MSGILTVCDANICRSVAAELLLEEAFSQYAALADVTVSSRGASAMGSYSACRMVVELRADSGWVARARRHASTQLTPDAVESADLILAATLGSRAAVVSMLPSARRRVFTLREAAWLAANYRPTTGAVGNALVQDLAEHIDARRGLQPTPSRRRGLRRRSEHPLDIADHHGSGRRSHAATLRDIETTVTELSRLLSQDSTLPFLSTNIPSVE